MLFRSLCRLQGAGIRVESALRELQAEYNGDGRHRLALLNAWLSCSFGWLLRQEADALAMGSASVSKAARHVARFSSLVDMNFQTHVPLVHYARQLGISVAHLNALCRQETGRSALELVHARVALEAKRMLVYTSMTVRDVSDALGFSDPAYFTRFFRRHAGVAPRDFRQRAGAGTTVKDSRSSVAKPITQGSAERGPANREPAGLVPGSGQQN